MKKTTFLRYLEMERDPFEALINQLGFTRKLTVGGVADGLTVKDLVADILSREHFIADRLSEILYGVPYIPCASFLALENFQRKYGYPDYESAFVEKERRDFFVVEKYRRVAFDEIVSQELIAYDNIVELTIKLSDADFLKHKLPRRIAEYTIQPYLQLRVVVNRWLENAASKH
ncbi:MAG: hypothetical protein LC099_01940 [Anaerolineales bacterium]|nr:hypothetical protein [Anaerolineales bacterium]